MRIRSLRLQTLSMVLLLILAACDRGGDAVLPTVAVLDTSGGDATTAAQVASPEVTSVRPTLPPEITLTPLPTATLPEPTPLPSATPEGFSTGGFMYYIFNGDLIMELNVDSGVEEAIVRFDGQPITDLALSADEQFLTYVAPGRGLAREVWVSSRDATYQQQVSCLNFQRVENPTWSPDNDTIAFFAASAVDEPLNLFVTQVSGSGNCPADNGQQQLTNRDSIQMRDIAWSPDGSLLFFGDGAVYGYEIASGRLSPPLTFPTSFGSDYAPAFNPTTNRLYYLKTERNFDTGLNGGALSFLVLETLNDPSPEAIGGQLNAQSLQWTADGSRLLIGTNNGVLFFNPSVGTAIPLAENIEFTESPTLSPDDEQVAYVAPAVDTPGVQQIFTINRTGDDLRQITKHDDGSIEDVVWAAS